MSQEANVDGAKFKVICTWCGTIIRRTSSKDSRGMCLKCYSRMLHEHHRAEGQRFEPRWASKK